MSIGEICSRDAVFVRRNGVRRLPVVDASGALVGVLAADDLIELLGEELSGLGALLAQGPGAERARRRAAA